MKGILFALAALNGWAGAHQEGEILFPRLDATELRTLEPNHRWNFSSNDWWPLTRDAFQPRFRTPKQRAQYLSREKLVSESTPTPDLIRHYDELLRSGLPLAARTCLTALENRKGEIEPEVFELLFRRTLSVPQSFELARTVLEVFEESYLRVPSTYEFISEWQASGASGTEIEAWFAQRSERPDDGWEIERMQVALRFGWHAPLFQDWLQPVVEGEPGMDPVWKLMRRLYEVRYHATLSAEDQSKLEEALRRVPIVSAGQADQLSQWCAGLGLLETALRFDAFAVELEWTLAELDEATKFSSRLVEEQTLRRWLRIRALERWAEHFLQLKRGEQAQEKMLAAAAMRERFDIPTNMDLAGRSQAMSGARVVEAKILEREPAEESSPAYWKERASYFKGRQEHAAWRHALEQGLACTRRGDPDHANFFRDLAVCLRYHGTSLELQALVEGQLRTGQGANDSESKLAVSIAAEHPGWLLRGDCEVYWQWLWDRPQWSHSERKLLTALYRKGSKARSDAAWDTTRTLALSGHPSRAETMGDVLLRNDAPQLAIPFLIRAAAHADTRKHADLQESLFHAYLESGQLEPARWTYIGMTQAGERIPPKHQPQRLGQLALLAAQQADETALKEIWTQMMLCDPSHLQPLEKIGATPLAEVVGQFYREWETWCPQSVLPQQAFERLNLH